MADKSGINGAAASVKKATKRATWTSEQRREAVEPSLIAGASVNEVTEGFAVRPSLLSR
jgi:transposase-like protein